jgi:hypothetical protein
MTLVRRALATALVAVASLLARALHIDTEEEDTDA